MSKHRGYPKPRMVLDNKKINLVDCGRIADGLISWKLFVGYFAFQFAKTHVPHSTRYQLGLPVTTPQTSAAPTPNGPSQTTFLCIS